MSDVPAAPRKRGKSRERVRVYLEARGLAQGLVEFEQSTKTAQDAADALRCDLGQVVKSLVLVVGEQPVLALVGGDRRADTDAIGRLMGGGEARLADPATVRAVTGYTAGGVAPFDLSPDIPVFLDSALTRFESLCVGAGTPTTMARVPLTELVELSGARVADISQ